MAVLNIKSKKWMLYFSEWMNVSPSAVVRLYDVFLIVCEQQWTSMEQKNKPRCGFRQFIAGFSLYIGCF